MVLSPSVCRIRPGSSGARSPPNREASEWSACGTVTRDNPLEGFVPALTPTDHEPTLKEPHAGRNNWMMTDCFARATGPARPSPSRRCSQHPTSPARRSR
jgi:hypothetical protein